MSRRLKEIFSKNRKDTKGAAMIIVLCIMAIFLALSVSVLLAGSVALNTAKNNITYERAKVQAVTLSDLIVNDMKDTASDTAGAEGSLQAFLKSRIKSDSWPSYDPEGSENPGDGAVVTYNIETGSESKYPLDVEICWYPDPANSGKTGDLKYNGAKVWITVISEIRSPGFQVESEFELGVTESASASGSYEWKWTYNGRQ